MEKKIMKKNIYRPGPMPINVSCKHNSTEELFDIYEGTLRLAAEQEDRHDHQEAKKSKRNAVILKNYIIRDRIKGAPLQSIKTRYTKSHKNEKAGELLLNLFAKEAKDIKDIIWAYNENYNEHEDIDYILEKKLKKISHIGWYELLEEETKGSRICYFGIKEMITKTKTLGDLLCTLESNKINIPNVNARKANQEKLMKMVHTVKTTKKEKKEFKDEIQEKDRKMILLHWK